MNNYGRFKSSCNQDANHILIKNNDEYITEKKLLYISSNDRDIAKWPNANDFEIMCPQSYLNVQSLRLVDIQIPKNLYNISEHLQNNKMKIYYNGTHHIIIVPDGIYTSSRLALALENLLTTATGATFIVEYNEVTNKFYFKNDGIHDTSFDFDSSDLSYNSCPKSRIANNVDVHGQYDNWGLGAVLGFDKKTYQFETITDNHDFVWENSGNTVFLSNFSGVISENMANLFGDNNIIMELEKYNSIDELTPYISSEIDNSGICASFMREYTDNSVYQRGKLTQIKNSAYYITKNFDRSAKLEYNGSINNAFAKIPITNNTTYNDSGSKGNISNISEYHPPIDKISKMRFRFRYHNGMLVDFQNLPVTFTIEIDYLRNDFKR